MATVYEQNLVNLSRDLGISSLITPQLSSQPFSNIWGGQDPSSSLSTSLEVPTNLGLSGEASRPLGNGSAQNSTQRATQKKSDIQSAFDGVQSLYSPTGGRPIGGSEDVRVKSDVYGRPYTVVSTAPTDKNRNPYSKAGQLSFGIDKNAPSRVGFKGPKSWEDGSDMSRDIQNAINAASATELPKIREEQSARADRMTALGFDPQTRERINRLDGAQSGAEYIKHVSNAIFQNTALPTALRGEASLISDDVKNKNFTAVNNQYGYGYGGMKGQLPKYPQTTSEYF
jgi:hypothetical protein